MPDQKLTYEELLIENENLKKSLSNKKEIEYSIHKEFIHFFEFAPAMVVIASTDGYFKRLNKVWEDVLGYTIEELKSKPFSHFIHPDDIEPTFKEVDRKSTKQTTAYFKNRYRCRNGEYKWLEWLTIKTPDDKSLYAIARDITESKKAEQALIESESRYKSIFHESKSIMLMIEPETGKIIDANNAALNYYAYSKTELLALSIPDINVLSKAQIEQEMQKAVDEKKSYFEFKHQLANGEIRDVQVFSSRIAFGEKSYLHSIIHDITAQQIAETALKKREAQLEKLNITKDKFFTIIAHDLRSPFNSILGYSELLIENEHSLDVTETKNIVKIINSSAQNTLSLLDNLLNWAKTQTEQINLHPQKIILSSVIQEIIEASYSIAKEKDISLKSIQSDEIEIYSDINILKTILRNLISNAIKFTKQEGTITISVVSEEKQIEISVSDNGLGINAEKLKKLFELSTNTTSTGTANEKGSGLGLVLCKEFVQKLGGDIWVESVEGKGSDFKFTLPMANEAFTVHNRKMNLKRNS